MPRKPVDPTDPAARPTVTTSGCAAPRDAAHEVVAARTGGHRPDRPPVRWRLAAAVAGGLAAALALGIGLIALSGDGDSPDGDFRAAPGPSARHITARPTAMPLTDAQILQLLQRPPDLGTLVDPKPCLISLGYPADTPILGAAPVAPGVMLVLPAAAPSSVVALLVAPDCPVPGSSAPARTELARP